MGDYNGLRVDVTLTEEGAEVVRALDEERRWDRVALRFPWLEYLERYARVDRAGCIPRGDSAYIPAEVPVLDGRRWRFLCSLKNYGHTIERFVSMVLVEIVDEWDIVEAWFEYDDYESDDGVRRGRTLISRRRVLNDRGSTSYWAWCRRTGEE